MASHDTIALGRWRSSDIVSGPPTRKRERSKKKHRPSTAKAPVANAFGCTFVIAPSFSLRLDAEDSVLFALAVKAAGFAVVIRSEVQPTNRLAETIEAEARNGIGPADALLSADALMGECAVRVLGEPNAGGASRVSEAMSAEVLTRAFGARLLKTELQIRYWPSNGAITDFAVEMEGTTLGVSVTRAIGTPGCDYTVEAAESLLKKKLHGVLRSTENACGAWGKQILHVWAPSARVADVLEAAYATLSTHDAQLTADTVVLISVCEHLPVLFEEKASTPPRVARAHKGAKDEAHLQVLADSDPTRHNAA